MIELQPMNAETFAGYQVVAIREYAKDKVAAGAWDEALALERSEQEFRKLLPQGVDTPDNHLFFMVAEEGATVGHLWFAVKEFGAGRMAFLYDIEVREPFRRRGYGRQALAALEAKVRALGISKIGLHVFGHNPGALALYEQAGYHVTDISMAKRLINE